MGNLTCKIPLNYQGMVELDTNFGGTPNWVKLAEGVSNITPANNEALDQKTYIDGGGFGSSDVIGAQLTLAVTLDRVLGDAVQDFVLGLQLQLGCSRKTQCRITDAEGNVKSGGCTIANIVPPGGDAATKGAWSFEIHFNGKPAETPATSAPALTATIAAGTVTGSTSFTATPAEGNTLGYMLTNAAPETPNALAYVNVLAYTSGANISATVGKSLCMVELDANGRVVKFATEVLESADIAA